MPRRFCLIVVLFVLWATPVLALPGVEAGPFTWRLSGYLKSLGSVTQGAGYYQAAELTERETFWNNASRVRLKSDMYLGDPLEFVVNYELFANAGDDQRLRRAAAEKYGDSALGRQVLESIFPDIQTPQYMALDHRIDENDDYRLDHRLDRLYLRMHAGPWDITLGRQALTWGPGRLWNPTDYLASFSPTEIDKEEKRGVDLLHTRISAHPNLTLEAYAAPVRKGDDDVDGDQSAAAGRAAARFLDAEMALSGGWLYDRAKVGLSFDGLLWDAGFRWAVTRTTVEGVPNEVFYQGVVNVDYAWGVRWNPYLLVEYYHNGFGKDDPDEYADLLQEPAYVGAYQRGEVFNVGRNYAGAVLSLQPHALVMLGETLIVNLGDSSLFNNLVVTWSVVQNLDVLLGAQHSFGSVPSEYGGVENPLGGDDITVPDFYYTYLKYYF
ncbi:MAG: hypothetical protein P9L99_06405 [Candidatus Lernaella stagnicola]|nr:hypothetical protein [Candidatus Lernaella stagnicola]